MNDRDFFVAVGENIAFARGERGLRGKDLAALVGVTKSAVSQWENGQYPPRLGHLFDIARVLGISPRDLLPEEGETT